MVPLSFAGREFIATREGALFAPWCGALFVADLHLEKANWFARLGQMLPPYDSVATLALLHALIVRLDVQSLWCLGDNFHDSAGAHRLSEPACELLAAIARSTAITWIVGNHDHALEEKCGGEIAPHAVFDGLSLRHEASVGNGMPELSGHFHPRLRIASRGRNMARPCFVRGPTKLILPAFGSLTGGMDAFDRVILGRVGAPADALVVTGDRLLSFPSAVRENAST